MGTVTKKIGTAGAGRDYSLLQSWEDALPANLVSDGNNQVAELYADSEFVGTTTLLTIGGQTTSSTFNITVRCATGQSFSDNASKATNRFAYVAANGVAIRSSVTYSPVIFIQTANVILEGLQVKSTASSATAIASTAVSPRVDMCILQSGVASQVAQLKGATALIRNSLVIQDANAGRAVTFESGGAAVNCTFVRPSNRTPGGSPTNTAYGAATVRNCAIFGFTGAVTGSYNADGHNVTDSTAAPGSTSNLTSQTYANQFEQSSTASSLEDYRAKSGAPSINAGVVDTTNVPSGTDVIGTARGATWDSGAWEFASVSGNTGTLAWTEQNDVAAITGYAMGASLSWTEANDTANITAVVTNNATLGWTEASDATAISGSVAGAGNSATAAWIEANDETAIAGAVTNNASLGWTEDADVTSIGALVLQPASGELSWTEANDFHYLSASTVLPHGTDGHGFEMVSMEPSWKRALRLRAEKKEKVQRVELSRKQRKRAEFIEKLAAKEALSSKPDAQIDSRIESLLSEWVALAPKLELKPVAELPHEDAYRAFMARVAEHVRRLEEDDEYAAEMLLLM